MVSVSALFMLLGILNLSVPEALVVGAGGFDAGAVCRARA
jgi:hypothetical protein